MSVCVSSTQNTDGLSHVSPRYMSVCLSVCMYVHDCIIYSSTHLIGEAPLVVNFSLHGNSGEAALFEAVLRYIMHCSLLCLDIGYAQGMNDILARFLVVTDSEVDSYWMFSKYMEQKMEDFQEETMMRKVCELRGCGQWSRDH